MNLAFIPRLEHIAYAKIAVFLWSDYDLQGLASLPRQLTYIHELPVSFRNEEAKISERISGFCLPELIKKNMKSFIRPIGLQMAAWMFFHRDYESFVVKSTNFCWTSFGTIDNKKTAKVMVKNESLDIGKRLKLACTYCLENSIYELWAQVPYNIRVDLTSVTLDENTAMSFWLKLLVRFVENPNIESEDFNEREIGVSYPLLFKSSVDDGNAAAARYFLQYLTPRFKDKVSMVVVLQVFKRIHDLFMTPLVLPKCQYVEVLIFLFSVMSEEQRLETWKNYPRSIFTSSLTWPWCDVFMEIFVRMQHFLPHRHYLYLLEEINNKIILNGYKDQHYQHVFAEVWRLTPASCKPHIVDYFSRQHKLINLCEVEENISLIFKDVSDEKKREILLDDTLGICEHFIIKRLWDSFQIFIRTFSLSKDMLMEFKEKIRYHIVDTPFLLRITSRDKEMAFQILDELIQNSS